MSSTFHALLADEAGAAAIEYGVIAAVVLALAIPAANMLGGVSAGFAALSMGLSPDGPALRLL